MRHRFAGRGRAAAGETVNIPQRIAYNTAVQVVGRAASLALGLVSFSLVARHLGAAGFGAYSLVLTLIPLVASFADVGLTTIGVREMSKHPEQSEEITGNLFTLKLLLGMAATGLGFAVIPLSPYDHDVENALRIAVLGLV